MNKLYNNSHNYNLRNKNDYKSKVINDNATKSNVKNTTDKKYLKEYNKRNLQNSDVCRCTYRYNF